MKVGMRCEIGWEMLKTWEETKQFPLVKKKCVECNRETLETPKRTFNLGIQNHEVF